MKSFFLLVVAVTLFGGCASSQKLDSLIDPEDALIQRSVRNDIPFIPQEARMCGPTVLQMLAIDLQQETDFQTLRKMSFNEREQGTFKSDFLSASRRIGLAPYRVDSLNELIQLSAEGHPVVVFQNLGLPSSPQWHYALVVGYDLDRNEVLLHSGTTAYQRMSFPRFLKAWDWGGSWAYQLARPADFPDRASFEEALDNAIVFDELAMLDQALEIYESMKFRWPDRFEPYLGSANVHFFLKDFESAVQDLERAIARNPRIPALYFNLAVIHFERGNLQAAKRWKALALQLLPDEERDLAEKRMSF